jgi:hypothetical protein
MDYNSANVARKKKTKVFVSYSRHDESLVKPLAGLLGVAAEDAVFLDVSELKPGDLWEAKIVNAVKESSVFILCWCCESRLSTFVAKEISTALTEGDKRMVPVLFCSSPLPENLADRQWIDLRGQVVHHCTNEHESKKTSSFHDASEHDTTRSIPPPSPHRRSLPSAPQPPIRPRKTNSRPLVYSLVAIVFLFLVPLALYQSPHSAPTANPAPSTPLAPSTHPAPEAPSIHPTHGASKQQSSVLNFTLYGLAGAAAVFTLFAMSSLTKGARGRSLGTDKANSADDPDLIAGRARSYFQGLGKK